MLVTCRTLFARNCCIIRRFRVEAHVEVRQCCTHWMLDSTRFLVRSKRRWKSDQEESATRHAFALLDVAEEAKNIRKPCYIPGRLSISPRIEFFFFAYQFASTIGKAWSSRVPLWMLNLPQLHEYCPQNDPYYGTTSTRLDLTWRQIMINY